LLVDPPLNVYKKEKRRKFCFFVEQNLKTMNSSLQCCLNEGCSTFQELNKNNIVIHSRQEKRYKCKVCQKTFSERKGTAFFRLRKSEEVMTTVITLLNEGCPLPAAARAFDLDIRTVEDWAQKGGQHAQAVHQQLVWGERDLGQVQADEFYVKLLQGKAWVGMAMAVSSRLWLGCSVGTKRNKQLIYWLLWQVFQIAAYGSLLLVTDGFSAYGSVAPLVFSRKVVTGQAGRPQRVTWANLQLVQVVKSYSQAGKRFVCHGAHHIKLIWGTFGGLKQALNKSQTTTLVNTAYIERMNATFRMGLSPIMRRTRYLIQNEQFLEKLVWLKGAYYNFCTPHTSLSKQGKTTPAMKAGITERVWTTKELLGFCTLSGHTRLRA
jgi:transposase-like protein